MGFFSSSSKKISRAKLEQLLRKIPILEMSEREYVKGLFIKYQSGGIYKREVLEAVRRLKLDTSDKIDRTEAEAIKKELLDYLKG